MPTEANMCEVVRRLRAERSEALQELQEFDYAIEAILQNLESLARASQEHQTEIRGIVGSGEEEDALRWTSAEQHATRLNDQATRIVGAFQQLHNGVLVWNIVESRGHSNLL